jgi:hypothetical protein
MAITPYVRIPYASERDRYTGRAYTAQQLALMDRQSARESAYASDRAQRMSDRWSGFGGLITETLGDLRQSREVREAQALEQERYDEEQARLAAQDKRSIDLYDRTLLGQQVARIRERTRAGGDLSEADAETMRLWDAGSVEDYERPASEQATLASLAAPPAAEMGDRAFANALPVEGLLGGGFGTAPDERGPVRFGETFAPVQDIGAGIPAPHIGPGLVAGTETAPATSGTRLRMTAAQGEALEAEVETDAQYRQQRALSIEALEDAVKRGVMDSTQATTAVSNLQTDGSLPPSAMTLLMKGAEAPTYPSTAFASFRDSGVQAFRDQYGREPTGAELQTIISRAMSESRVAPTEPPTFTPGFPKEVNDYLATLAIDRDMTRDQATANIYTQWAGWTAKHKGLSLPEVQAVIDEVWPPPPRTGGMFDNFDFSSPVLGGDDLPRGIAPQLTEQQEKDLGTAEVLVEKGLFATIPEALQSIRESENPEVPVLEVPAVPPSPPQVRYAQPSRRGGLTLSDRIAMTPGDVAKAARELLPRGTPQPPRRTATGPFRGVPPRPRGNTAQ